MTDRRVLGALAAVHFLVDMSCAYWLFRGVGGPLNPSLLVMYNFCAFALQMPLGAWLDRWGRGGGTAALGCGVCALAWVPGLPPVPGTVLLGLGNALFHIGGGVETLARFPAGAGPLGVFVSPGAAGLYLGTLLGRGGLLPVWLPAAGLLLSGAALSAAFHRAGAPRPPGEEPDGPAKPRRPVWPVLAALLAVVALRSHVGMALAFPWKTGGWAAALALALTLGKAAGGFLGDRFGPVRTAAATLLPAAGLFLLSDRPVPGVLAVFLFNMTMPLTLYGASRATPGLRGFSFGLLTFGLFLGFLPVCLGAGTLSGAGGAVCALVSAALLLPGLRGAVGHAR